MLVTVLILWMVTSSSTDAFLIGKCITFPAFPEVKNKNPPNGGEPIISSSMSRIMMLDPHHGSSIFMSMDSFSSSSLMVSVEVWRQYVALAVVAGVLVDILLGSPLANAALKPLRDAQEQLQDAEEGKDGKTTKRPSSKERIDSDKVAQDAIARAENALELKRYLEERKTDWDRMEELKRNLDKNMQELDEDLKARQGSLEQQETKKNKKE
eukprot:CAMPEP_0178764768 /NCGR_PEP_ID=MMETSP0744-20121128/18016_1 /TAXON_ID=913974 /ORGANISM="Nitzschia punctata, Strain CCMP561" /LENGTH=210 /DNA_ID=CAMNT_0020420063 /DNA_START=17 /DNA_END=649 /DNA_ORIENTATION=-